MKNIYNKAYFDERDILIPHLAETITAYARKNNLKTILDVGCGTGKLVKYLRNQKFIVSGCDIAKEAILKARKINPAKSIIHSSAATLSFNDNIFDMVISISVIEHLTINEAVKFIKESKRVLNKNGFIFLVTPNFATPLRFLSGHKWFAYQDPTHINFYTPKTLSRLLVTNGFKNPKTQFNVSYNPEIDNQFPALSKKMPLIFKKLLVHLLFNSPLYIIRNSFWISAQKNG